MNIYISIDGVLRNFVNRFHYHYEQAYIDVEESESDFEYKVNEPITNLNIDDHFVFQSKDEQDYFRYIEYPMELYGHSPVSYSGVNNELNKFIFENKEHTITLVGVDELGKSIPSTFFFLSRNAFICNNVKFILSDDLEKEWETVDVWVSDSKHIMESTPEGKRHILFETPYNQLFTSENKITKLNEININGEGI
jgi:hypothetical protein